MSRGKETTVHCDQCGRAVPRNKGVMFDKPVSFNTGMQNTNDVRFFERRKVWYCISCAKHRGIFEKKKRLAIDRAKKML